MKTLLAAAGLLLAVPAPAETIALGPHRYEVTAGVTFNVANLSSTSYLFTWADDGGLIADVEDPTLVLHAGETYVFRRVTSKHPLLIADDTLPLDGGDGAWVRTTAEAADLDAAILQPADAFTADPALGDDPIAWTPAAAGDYAYTCNVPAHVMMTGRIVVTAPDVPAPARRWEEVKARYR